MNSPFRWIVAVLFLAAVALPGTAGATEVSLHIPAASFSSDGRHQDDYSNWGWYLDSNYSKSFHAGVMLPNAARITNVDMMTQDDDANTITMYLKRTKFGVDGGTETLMSFSSPGNLGCQGGGGLCHDMRSGLDIKVDAANYAYWLELHVPDTADPQNDLWFHDVRILYEVGDVIFADTFESADTAMWDGDTTAKAESSVEDGPVLLPETTTGGPADRAEQVEQFLASVYIEDPLAQEALEQALQGKGGYASPLLIPATAFKTKGYNDYDDYYFSETGGYIYGRPAGTGVTTLITGLHLPDGAEISYLYAFFVDSIDDYVGAPKSNIDFDLVRYRTTNGDIAVLADETSIGADDGIRSIWVSGAEMDAVVPDGGTITNPGYYYYLRFSLGPYDTSPPAPYDDGEWWHKIYAVLVLYTMP